MEHHDSNSKIMNTDNHPARLEINKNDIDKKKSHFVGVGSLKNSRIVMEHIESIMKSVVIVLGLWW